MVKDLEFQTDVKFEHNHCEMIAFQSLDNCAIDSVYRDIRTLSKDQSRLRDELLAEQELIHYLRKIAKHLEHLLDLSFCKFWAFIVKFPVYITFMDDFLQKVRKYNDLDKITIDLD